jgi:hypothetical protein
VHNSLLREFHSNESIVSSLAYGRTDTALASWFGRCDPIWSDNPSAIRERGGSTWRAVHLAARQTLAVPQPLPMVEADDHGSHATMRRVGPVDAVKSSGRWPLSTDLGPWPRIKPDGTFRGRMGGCDGELRSWPCASTGMGVWSRLGQVWEPGLRFMIPFDRKAAAGLPLPTAGIPAGPAHGQVRDAARLSLIQRFGE